MSFEVSQFQLELPIGFNARVRTDRSFEDSSFSKLGFSTFIYILKIRVPTRVFPFYVVWSFEFRLELPIWFNARVGTDRSFEDSSFQNSGFPFLLLFWRSGFRLGFSVFISFEVSSSDSNFLSDSTLVLESIVPLKIRVFKTRVFHFYYYFEDPASDSGFPFLCCLKFQVSTQTSYRIQRSCWNRSFLWRFEFFQNSGFPFLLLFLFWRFGFRLRFFLFISFEVSSSDSNFLSDSTLVLEPIVPLKIRVFKTRVFHFYFYFEDPGSDSGFPFLCRLKFRVSTRTSYRIQRSCWNRSFLWKFEFSKLGFSIFIIILKIRVPTRVFPFYVVWSFEFRLELPIGFNARVGTDRSFEDSSFSKLGFSIFIIILKIRVPTRVFPFYVVWSFEFRLELPIGFNARVGTDRSFEDSSFSKLGFSIFIIILKIRVPTRVFPFYIVWSFEFRLELPIRFNARVGTDRSFKDSSFSKLGFSIFIFILKIRVPTRVFPFYVVWSFEFRLKLPIGFNARVGTDRSFEDSSFSKLGFSIFIIILKIRVPTRVFPFYVVWSFEFRLELPIGFNARVGTDRSFEDSSFSKLGFSIFIFILKIRVPTRVFPFYVVWSFEFRLELPIGFNARVGTDRSFEDSSFSKLGFSIFIIILKIRVPTRVFPFYVVWSFEFRLELPIGFNARVGTDRSFENSSFQNSGFPFLLLFWRSGFRLGFSLFMSFEVSSSDSNFLSDSTLVLEPIVPLKIRVFKTRVFHFYYYFEDPGSDSGFPFLCRLKFRVPTRTSYRIQRSCWNRSFLWRFEFFKTRVFHFYYYFEDSGSDSGFSLFYVVWSFEFRLELPIRFNARVGTDRSFEDSSFSKLGFSIFIFILKIRVPTRVFPFYVVWSFEFRLELPIGFNARVGTDRSFEDSSFSKLGFSIFIIILKIRVPTRVFPFYVVWSFEFRLELPIGFNARVGTDRSFEDSSFSKLGFSIFIIILKIRVPTRVFPFYVVWSFEFRLELPIGFNARVGTDRSFEDSSFSKLGFSIFIIILKIRVPTRVFPFYVVWSFEFRLELPIGFNARVGTDRSFEDSSFSKLGFSIFIIILKIRVPTRVFPFYVVWSFEFRLELPIGFNARVGTDRSFEDSSFSKLGFSIFIIILKIRVPTRVFPFYVVWSFEFRLELPIGFNARVGTDRSFEDSSFSKLGFSIFIIILKIRVPTRVFPFYVVWSFEFRLELPIGFNARVGTDRSFEDSSFSKLGFSIFIIILKIRVPTRVFPFYVVWSFEFRLELPIGFNARVGTDRSFEDSSFSKLGFSIFIIILKIRVPTQVFPFYIVWSFEFRLELPIRFNARVGTDRSFEDSSFSKLGFSIFIIILKIRVPTRVFPFYVVWSFEFRLELPIGFNARVGTDRSFEDSSFSKLGFSIFIIILKIRVPTRVFPFYVVWSFEFRLELPIGFNARVGTDRSFEDSSFQNSGFPFLLLFWRSGFRLGFSLFMSFEVSSSDSNFLSDSTLVLEPIVPLKIRVFQNSGFPFLLLFWRSGFRLGFSLFMSFEVSSSDSNFLSDSTLVLEPIVPLKIRVFQNSGFPFLFLFWRSGFRLGFSLFMSFEVSSFDSNFLSDSTLVLEPIVPLKIRVFQNSGFPFLLLFWRSGFRLGFSLFMSFEVSSSDSNFLSDSTLVLEPIVPLKIRVFQNSGFPFLLLFWRSGFRLGFFLFMSFEVSSSDSNFLSDSTLVLEPIVPLKIRVFKTRVFHFYYYFEDPGSDSGFPFLCRLKFRVPTRTSYRIQRSCWNRSFLWRFEFFKTRVFHFYYYFEDPGSDSGFPFLCRLKFRVPTRTSYRIQRSCWNRSFLWRFEFFKTRVFHFYYYFEDPGSDSGFPFLCRLKFRVPTRTSYRIQRSCWNRSFLWRFEFFKTRVFHFYYYFEDPGSDSGFPFLCRLKFRVPTRTSYRIQRSCWNRSFLWRFEFFKTRVFHFYYYFEDSGSDSGFPFLCRLKFRVPTRTSYRIQRSCWNRSFLWRFEFSKLGFSIFIIILKIRVPTRVFPFYVVWSFEFRLELPIGFNARVGTDRSFENSSFQNSGFPFLLLFWRSGFRLGFSLFMSFEVSSFDSNFLSNSTLVLEPIVPLKIRVFQNSGFPFLLLFWRFGFRLRFFLFISFEVSSSDSNFLSDSTLVLEPIVPLKIRVFQNSGFPFLLLFWRSGFRLGFSLFMSFEVSSSDSNFLSDSTLVLEPIVPLKDSSFSKLGFSIFIIILKIRVPTRVFPFYVVWSFEFRLELPIGFNARVGTDRSFEDSSFSKLGFSIFIIILKIRVPTRVFPFYVVWSFEFRLELPIGFNARVGTDRSFEDSSFQNSGFPFLLLFWRSGFRLGFSLFMSFEVSSSDSNFLSDSTLVLEPIVPLKIRVFQNSGFPFLLLFWRSGFRLGFSLFMSFEVSSSDSNFLSDSTLVLEPIVPLKIRVFQNSGFPFLLLFWRSGFRLGFSLFMSFEVSSSDSNFLSDSTLVLEPIVPLKIRVFQNSGFPFLLLFWRSGFRLGFSLFMSFEVSSSDSNFLSDSTLVLEPIVPLKIRVFQNSGFPFLLLFWRSGFRLGFSLFMSFEVSSSDSNFLSDSTLVLEPIVPLKIRVFQNSGFPFLLLFWRSGFRLGFSLFMSFEVSSSDSNFLSDSTLVLEPIVPLKIRVFKTRVFHFYYYFEDPGSDSGFPFLCRLKFRVPTRTSYRIQRSCWNRSFLWRFEFFKTRVFHFYYYFEDPGSDSGFPFLCRLKFRVPTRTSYRIQRSCWNRSFLWRFEFFKTRVFHFYYYFEDPGSDSGFPFLCRLKFRVPTRTSYRIQRSCWNRSFLWRFEFFKTRVFHFYYYFEDPGSDSGFPFLCRLKFRVPTRTSYRIQRSCWNRSFLWRFEFFKTRVFHFYYYFEDPGSDSGFPFLCRLKFRVPTRTSYRIQRSCWNRSFLWRFEFFKTRVFHFYYYFEDPGSDSGFPFLCRLKFRVPTRTSYRIQRSCWNRSFLWRFEFFKTRVFHFYYYFEDPGSDSGFPFLCRLKFRVPTRTSYRIQRSCWNRSFLWRFEFSKLGFSIFIIILKIRVPTRVFPFYVVWSFEFRLELPIGFNARVGTDRSFEDSSFSKLGFSIFIFILKIRVPTRVFPFYVIWSFEFRLELPIGFNARVGTDRSFEDSSFQNSGFPFLLLFWRSGFRLGFSLFMSFEVSSSDSNFLSDSTLVLEPIVPLKIRVFQNSGFPFLLLFWRSGFRLGFSLFMSFEVSSSDSNFLSDSTLVLEPIVPLKIRVFQNSGFPFLLLFWRSGFRLGFSLFMSFEVSSSDSNFLSDSTLVLEPIVPLKIRVFKTRVFHFYYYFEDPGSDSGFPFLCRLKFRVPTRTSYRIQRSCWNRSFLWRFEFFKTRVFHFYYYFEDPGSDSGFPFLCRLKFRVPTRTSYRIQRSCWNRSFLWRFEFFKTRVFHFYYYFEDPGSDSGFPFLCRLKFRVPTRTSYRIQRSCWNRSFLWRFEFSKLGFSIFIIILKIRVPTRVFPFYVVWSFEFRLELPIEFNARVGTDRSFEDSSFSKLGFSIFIIILKIRVPTQVFPFYIVWSFEFRLELPIGFNARVGTDRSFEDSSFSKLGFSIFIFILKIRVPTRVFPFYVVWSFEFRLELPIGFNARVGTDRSFEDSSFSKLGFSIFIIILKIRVPTRVFPFYVVWSFEFRLELPIGFNARVGTDRSFEDSSFSKLGFSIFIIILKIRVPTRVFPFYVVWSFEFRLELPIRFNARVGTDRSFENSSFQNSGFPFLLLFWRSGFRLGFSLFMSFEVSSSDSNFLSDSTLVLEPIVPLKIRVFQNSGFPFLLLFWRSGFRLGFSLFMSFEVSSSDSNFLSDSTLVLEPIVPLKIRVFQNSGFPFLLLFWRSGFRLGFSFLCRLKFRVPTRTSYRIQRSCWNRSFLWRFEFFKTRVFHFYYYFEDPGSDSGFPFLCRLKFRVPTRTSYRIQRSCWNRSFLWRFEFFKTRVFHFYYYFEDSGSDSGFSFLYRLKFRVPTRTSYRIQRSCWNRSFLWRFEFFKTRVFHFYYYFEDPGSDSGFPFLCRLKFRVPTRTSYRIQRSCWNRSFLWKFEFFKTRVFHFYYYFEDPGSDSGFPFLCRLKFRVPTRTSYRIQRSCWNRSFLWRFEFSKLGFSIFIIILKIRVPTRVFPFYVVWSFEFRLELPIGFNARVGTDRSFEDSSFSKLGFSIFIIILKIRVPTRVFPFYVVWSFEFRLELPIGFNARVGTDRSFEDSSFFRVFHFYYYFEDPGSDSGFPFLCPLKFRVPTRTSYRIQRSCWNRSFLWRFEFFKTRVFHFYYYFEDPGSDSGFPFLCRLKFRVPTRTSYRIQCSCWNRSFLWRFEFFKTRVFHFYYYFEDPGSDSGFPFLCRLKFRVPTRTSYRIQRSCWNRSFLWRFEFFKTRVFHFYYYFEDPGSDSGFPFLCHLKFRVPTRTSYRIQRSCWNRSFLWRFEFFKTRVFHFYYYFEDPGSDSGFPFLCRLKFRVPTRTSYRIQRSCWNRSFLWRFEFFKTRVFHFYYYFEDPGSDSGFPFLCRLKFRVPTRTSYRIQRSCWNRSFLWRFEFFKTRVFHFYYYFEDPGSDSGFPFLCRLKFRVPTRTSYRIQRSCWNRSFLWRFEFFKTRVFHFYYYFEDPGSDSGFPFLCRLKFRVPTRTSYQIQSSCWNRSFLWKFEFSKLGFSIFIIILKIRVPTRVFPFYVVWSFEFRLELPIGFNARVGTDRSFEDSSFQNSGFPFLLLFWRSGFRLRFSLFMSFEVSSFDSNFLSNSTLVLEPIVPLKIRVFQNSGFPFLLLFWRFGFRLRFFLFISFEVSSSDSNFLSDSTLVLEPIVHLKIRVFQNFGFSIFIIILKIRVPTRVFPFYVVWSFEFRLELPIGFNARVGTDRSFEDSSFQNSGFPFLLLFWRSGFRLGFSLFMSFEVSSSDSNFLSDSTLVLEPIVPLKIRVFKTRVFHFYYYFEDPGSDSGFPFLCRLKFRVPTRTSYRIQRSCWNRSFLWRFEFFKTRVFHFYFYFEDPGSDSGFSFLCRLKFRVPTRTSYQIQRSCWNRSFLWKFEFSKLGFSIFIIILKIRVPTRVFPFYVVWSFEFRLELPIGFNARVGTDRSFEDSSFSKLGFSIFIIILKIRVPTRVFPFYVVWSFEFRLELPIRFNARVGTDRSFWKFEFFKTRVFHFYYYFEDPGSDSGFPFLCRLKFRVPTRTSYRIQRSCWNRSFLWRFEFFKTRVFHFYYYFEDPGSDSGFPFLCRLKFRVPTRTSYRIQRSCWNRSFLWRFEFFKTRVFHFYYYFEDPGSDSGFSFLCHLKFRVPTRTSYQIQRSCWNRSFLWRFKFFKTRVFHFYFYFEDPGSDSGFPFLCRLKFRVPTRTSYRIQRSCWNRSFLWTRVFHFYYYFEYSDSEVFSSFSKLGFSIFIILFWRSGFRLGFSLFMSFEVSSSDSNFLSDSTLVLELIVPLKIRVFSKLGFSIFIIILKIRVPTRVFPFYVVWSFEFRLELPIGFNARVGTDRSFENSSFQNSGFPFLLLFWRSGFRLGFSLFMSFEVSSSDSNFLSDSTLVLEPIVPLKIRVFQNLGFPFLLLFWRSGFRLGFSLFMSFEVSSSDSNFLSDSTLVLEPIVPLKIRVFQNSGFPFLLLFWRSGFRLGFFLFMSFEVSSSDSNFLSDSTLVLEPIVPLKIRVFKTRVFHFYYYFEDPGSDSGFPFLCRLKFRVPTRTSYRIQRSCWNRSFLWIRVFQNSSFFKTRVFHFYYFEFWRSGFRLGFSHFFLCRLKFRVPTRTSYRIQRSCWNRSFLWRFEFFKTRVFHFYYYFEDPGSDSGFPFLCRLKFRVSTRTFYRDSTLVLEPIVPLKIRVFQNSGFPFLLLFWRSGFRLGFSLFMSFEVSSSDSNFLSDSTLVLEPIVPLKIRVFQNSGFPFLLLFWRSGFRLGFSLFMSFEVSSSDSNFLSDSTLVLEPIVPLKIRVFQNSGFSFLLLFWRSGFRLGFSLFMSFEVSSSDSNFLSDSTLVLEPIVPLKIRVFQNSWVFHFYFYFEDPGSDSGFPFLCRLKFRVPTRTSYRIQRSCWNRSFLWKFEFFKTRVFHFYYYFEDPGSDSGFSFLCRLKFRVPTQTSYRIQRSCWNRSFLWRFEFFKTRVFHFYYYFEDPGSDSGFSFLCRLKFRVPTRTSYRIQRSCWNRSFLWRFEFFKTRVFHFYYYFEDPGSDSGFPFLCRLKFRVPTRTSYRIQRSCWNRSFLWRFEFFKTRVFHFYYYFEDPGSDSGFSFLCRLKFRVPTRTSYQIQRSCWNRSFLYRFEFFKTRVFHFYYYFEDPGSDSGFPFLCRLKFRIPTRTSYRIQRSCWNRSFLWRFEFSKLGFSIFIIILKIRVPTRVFPFYVVWSFEFRLELPIGFNARVGTDRSFEDSSFSKLGFSIFIIILKIRVPTRVFPFYVVWSFEFRLELPIGFNARVGTDRSFENSSFQNSGFPFFLLFWRSGFRLGFSLFMSFEVSSSDSNFLSDSTLVLEPIVPLKIRVFQNSGFPFLLLFWRSGFRLGFSLFMSFEVSSSDSNFLSNSTLVLEPIVPLKIRVFQNSGFPFLLLFWRSGFRLGFSLFMSFEVSSSDSNFLSDSTLVLEPIVPLKIWVFQNSGFPFLLLFWRSGFRLGFSLFMSFEVSSSDSNFLSDSTLVLEPIVPLKIQKFSKLGFSIFIIILKIRVPTRVFPFYVVWSFEFRLELPIGFNARVGTDRSFEDSSFQNSGFHFYYYFEDPGSDSGFPFLCRLKFRVPTRTSYRIQRSCWNRSFLWRFEFSKLGFSIFIIILKIRVPTRVFPFYVVWSFEFRLELPIRFNARVGTDRSFENSSFQNSGFPFLLLFWRSGFRLGFSLFMSFEVSSSDSNFLSDSTLVLEPIVPLKIRVFQNSGFPFLLLFWRSGFRLGFSLFMSFEVSSSDSNFLSDSTLELEPIVLLKIRVFQNSGFPFLLLFWRFGFRLRFFIFISFEVSSSVSNFLSDSTLVLEPIVPMKIRVFQNSGFPFLLLFWGSGFRLVFSLFMSFEVSSSDSKFLSDSTLVLEPIIPLKIRVFQNSGFPFLLLFWGSGFRHGFLLFMSFEVSSSDSNFLSDLTLVLEPIVPLKIRVFQNSGFPFLLL